MSTLKALSALLLTAVLSFPAGAEPLARPWQYVAIAFDGSKTIKMWEETRNYSKAMVEAGTPVTFTYFLSGVVFLKDSEKRRYQGPKHTPGQSDISFGGDLAELSSRITQVNLAVAEGQEMASHANGHFDGGEGRWSEADWMLEFKIFNSLLDNVIPNNALGPPAEPLNLQAERDIAGFRAPYLGTTAGLWSTLKNYKFRYDTSRATSSNYWPQKLNGVWNFPLADLRQVDTNKRTLSMDYNFYVADSGASPNPANSELYRSRMKRTYLKYFEQNYTGNRAPLHIGHHFSLWNRGAYYLALKDFATEVCAKPEVRCVTYKELADYMDGLDATTLAAYQKGDFERQNAPVRMRELGQVRGEKVQHFTREELAKDGIEIDPPAAHDE